MCIRCSLCDAVVHACTQSKRPFNEAFVLLLPAPVSPFSRFFER